MSYRLETARNRAPPPPLRFHNTPSKASIVGNENDQTLLYDLPSAVSPPPTSATLKQNAVSPTSPTFAGRTRGGRGRRMTPPPSHTRSTTPSRVAQSDIEEFAEHCRRWYYNQDEQAGRHMTQTLATIPPSQRAPFSRLQASIRSKYHAYMSAKRAAEFQAHLSATNPGGSLMLHSRADPGGHLARQERLKKFAAFVGTWCTMGMPGTKPFFEGLWAMMRLQVIPENLGGAGGFRIDWEIDDAVFKEAAGKDFMLEAIDVLKGVLAFEEVPSSKQSPASNWSSFVPLTRPHSRSQSQPLPSPPPTPNQRLPIPPTNHGKRPRAPSDPFSDTPALSRSLASSSSNSSGNTSALVVLSSEREPPSPRSDAEDHPAPPSPRDFALTKDEEEDYLRIWTSPDLSNPEYLSLLKLFPSFISRRALPRFPAVPSRTRPADIEEGEDEQMERRELQFGTGTMWVSTKTRSQGWKGTWWTRVILWWRRVFC